MTAGTRDLFQMAPPDGRGRCVGDCGDSIEVQLRLQGDCIERVAFSCDGCMSTAVAATTVTELVRGVELHQALQLTALDILDRAQVLDVDHEHCAIIAVNALHSAITDALRNRAEPWKQLYRT